MGSRKKQFEFESLAESREYRTSRKCQQCFVSIPGRWFRPLEMAGKLRKSMENGTSTPSRKIAELSGDFQSFPTTKNRNLAGRYRKISNSEYCFHEIAGIPRNRSFPWRTVRPGELKVIIKREGGSSWA